MAKRMQFSVVGLPHYTVWHLYEPSVDDIRHMEEMEQERRNRENEEKERVERMKKIKEEFNDQGSQWEKDKNAIDGISQKEEQIRKEHDAAMAAQEEKGPAAQAGKEIIEGAGSKDSKDNKDIKDSKIGKDAKDSSDATEGKDAKNIKDVKKTKDTANEKEADEAKVVNDT